MSNKSLREILDEFRSANCVDTDDTIAEIKSRLLTREEVKNIIYSTVDEIDGGEEAINEIVKAQAKKMEGK